MKKSISIVLLFFTSVAAAEARGQTALARELAGEMVSIPAGSFDIGDLSCDKPAKKIRSMTVSFSEMDKLALKYDMTCVYETPVHRVTVSAFKMGKYEVTFAQWDACVADGGCNGYTPDDEGWGRGNRPVIEVSWDDIQSFIDWLNDKTGGNYRLPTEAEWEYAVRAGTTTEYSWGNDIGSNRANCDDDCGDSWDYTAPVGSFPANAWGLHDMHGNVREWVQDCGNDSYKGAPTGGIAWTSGECNLRVVRGGSWGGGPWALRSADRSGSPRSYRGNDPVGFRLAQDE